MRTLLDLVGRLDPSGRILSVALLVAARLAPMTVLTPWIALRGTPVLLRAALLVGLTVAMTPVVLPSAPAPPGDLFTLAVMVVREGALGTVFALAVAIPFYALDFAGRLVDAMRGASQSETALPGGDRSSPLGALHLLFGTALFLALGGHRLALAALGDTWIAIPPGSSLPAMTVGALALGAARIVVASLTLAVAFAAPAATALVVVEIALGLIARTAPVIPMHFAGIPARAALGIGATLLALSVLMPHLSTLFGEAIEAAGQLFRQAAP